MIHNNILIIRVTRVTDIWGDNYADACPVANVHANAEAAINDNTIVLPIGGICSSELSDNIATTLTPKIIARTAKICSLVTDVPIQIAHDIESIGQEAIKGATNLTGPRLKAKYKQKLAITKDTPAKVAYKNATLEIIVISLAGIIKPI